MTEHGRRRGADTVVRRPAVAGTFYPADPSALTDALERAFAAARRPGAGAAVPKAIVVPHAAYPYSGPVAASGYLRLAPARARIRRAVVIGPSHFVPVAGVAVSGADAFATPLGDVPVDEPGRRAALTCAAALVEDTGHVAEHSVEVQLPFLQTVLDDFTVVPLAVGHATAEVVAAVLEAVWGGPETVVVVSTDLSHYHPHDAARALDERTADAVATLTEGSIGDTDACGAPALRGLLRAARTRGLTAEVLDLRTSGDTAGPRDRVVGYGAFALS